MKPQEWGNHFLCIQKLELKKNNTWKVEGNYGIRKEGVAFVDRTSTSERWTTVQYTLNASFYMYITTHLVTSNLTLLLLLSPILPHILYQGVFFIIIIISHFHVRLHLPSHHPLWPENWPEVQSPEAVLHYGETAEDQVLHIGKMRLHASLLA